MHQLPNQGPRSISEQANKILHSIWKCKLIPPNIKTFAWRLIRRALATSVRAGTFSIHIDMNCAYCGQQETDQHLFFTCTVPAQVWSSANPPFLTNHILEEEDGVQLSLSFLFQNDITDHDLCNKLFLLWYIWKARNDTRFQRKTWTANQIRLAAAAHINAHLDALQNPVSLDISLYTNNTSAGTEQRSFQTSDPFLVSFPSSFAGTRCYTDAATLPRQSYFWHYTSRPRSFYYSHR